MWQMLRDLDKKVEKNIPKYLLYACKFWAMHLQDAEFVAELAELVGDFMSRVEVLFWLEVLGVLKSIKEGYWALIFAERWFQVGTPMSLDVTILITQ